MPCPWNLNCEPRSGEVRDQTLSNPDFHPYVIHSMVDAEGHQKDFRPAVLDLTKPEYITDELCLAQQGILGTFSELQSDTSFARQMHLLVKDKPDAFIAIHRSGVPILDAVKSFYETLGLGVPVLDTVDPGGRWCTYGVRERQTLHNSETVRLGNIIAGANVAIVDDFFEHGSTLRISSNIIRNAGAQSIKALCGRWYRKIDQTNDRKANTTSDILRGRWSALMRNIGIASAAVDPSSNARSLQEVLANDPDGYIRDSFDFYINEHFISTE